MKFTDHAIRQFIRRHAPDMDFNAAASELAAAGPCATPTGRVGYRGAMVYSLPAIAIEVMAVKVSHGDLLAVTVLPVRYTGRQIDPREVYEAEQRLKAGEATLEAGAEALAAIAAEIVETSGKPATTEGQRDLSQRYRAAKWAVEEARLVVPIIRDELKTIRHEISTLAEIDRSREALKRAIRAVPPAMRPQVLEAVRAVDPGLASCEFLGF